MCLQWTEQHHCSLCSLVTVICLICSYKLVIWAFPFPLKLTGFANPQVWFWDLSGVVGFLYFVTLASCAAFITGLNKYAQQQVDLYCSLAA